VSTILKDAIAYQREHVANLLDQWEPEALEFRE